MRFFLAKTLVGLLAFGQALGTAYAFPYRLSSLIEKDQLSNVTDHIGRVERRAPPELTNWGQGPGTTWSGWVKESANSDWTTETIDHYVYDAWKKTQIGSKPPPILVAALWVQGSGVYLGSVPHGKSGDTDVQVLFDSMLRTQTRLLWQRVKDRIYKNTVKWHAEDMAMYVYEREERPGGPKYPPNSYMLVFGQYNSQSGAAMRPPCRAEENSPKGGITPTCKTVIEDLGIYSGC
jgi:hypothetical protein